MKIIKANTALDPSDTGYICYLTDLEARVLKDMCRKVGQSGTGPWEVGMTATRGMLSALGSASVMAPITYFSGSLQAI